MEKNWGDTPSATLIHKMYMLYYNVSKLMWDVH